MKIDPHTAAFLREHYPTQGASWCAERLGLTWRQVFRRAQALKLRQNQPWTETDDNRLRYLWGSATVESIAQTLGRTDAAVYWRAKVLDLGLGCPHGFTYLGRLAEDVGFSRETTRMILRWAGVRLRQGPKNPSSVVRGKGPEPRYATWIVEHSEGLEAVERFLAHETLNAAAERCGLSSETLGRWLVEDGRSGAKPKGKRRWYVSREVVDEVVQRKLAEETVTDASRRLGVRFGVVKRRLERAGVIERGQKLPKRTRFPVDAIDRAMEAT